MFLIIDRNGDQFFSAETIADAAKHCEVDASEISWQLKRTGRWDSVERDFTIIPNLPEEEE